MDREAVARELLAVARELTSGYRSEFMVLRPLVLDKEPAGTRQSLSNLRKILDAGYEPVNGVYRWDKTRIIWELKVFFKSKVLDLIVEHTFYGFAVGFGGEGPRGMMEAGKLMGLNFSKEKVLGGGLPESGIIKMRDLT